MKLQFLGTSACEFSPRLNTDLKDKFDKDARRSSSAIVNDRFLLDCGIYTPESLGIAGINTNGITDIFLTHLHRDHYIKENVELLAEGRETPLRVWVRADAVIDLEGVEIVRMTPYTTYEVADGVCVTGLPANHDPRAYPQHILLEVGERKLYYGIDGAWMLHDSFKFLKNKKLDIAVLDCTSGDYNGDFRMGEHNSIPMIRLMLPSLKTIGAIDEHTNIILTHLAPSLHKSHAETEIIANEFGATVAYDGRTVYTD